MYLNKNNASSSASSPDKEKKNVDNFKISFTDDYPRKNAEILSGQYGINLLLVGLSLMLALSYSGSAVKEECLLSLLITLMLLQIIWMMWYIIRKDRQTCFVSEKDSDAGTSWLRGGLSLLALISIIMDGFQIGYYVGYKACLSPAVGVYPVIHAVHTISQVHFLWFHLKDVIKTFATFARFGVIHAVFTNLLLWCNGVISEAKHFFDTHKRLLDLGNTNITGGEEEPHCNCTTNTCSILSNGLSYLYPFNIEYHIFVSVVLFVMWKNIGLTTEYQTNQNIAMRTNGLVAGPILGVVALASTIVVLVLYVIKVGDSVETRESAVTMFYCYGIVMLLFMCLAGIVGLLIFRSDSVPLDYSKNPSRKLDTDLLFGTAIGSWLMSWCSILAVIATKTHPVYRWINFMYSLLIIIEKYIQNLFIIESLYRKRGTNERDLVETIPEIYYVSAGSSLSLAPPYNGIVSRAFENQDKVSLENDQVDNNQGYSHTRSLPEGSSSLPTRSSEKLSNRRRVLKNIAVFLFLCNISLWILPAFGCRPQFDNGIEEETFGYTIWTTIVTVAMPLNLFYRMHSVVSLTDVFRNV
ncbi:proton channel OTOP1 [Polyodon spathula]|uniref:proton channel OTOP1 n=1 Tax=Polyodon spathula TaxID=7913 RepID=UPI001B7F1484|nr:proton channel OTOP1 [Polyodon spathula]